MDHDGKRNGWLRIAIATSVLLVACVALGASAWFQSEVRMNYRFHGEPLVMNDQARRDTSGSYVTLPSGVTHYELIGPPDGAVVALVHGFSVPAYIWDHNVRALTDAGFRVLRYDLLGRGLSDRPEAVCDLDLYDHQLSELITALDLQQPVDVAGVSLGGLIAARFTDLHPEMVRKLALLAPSGIWLSPPAMAHVITWPLVGEVLMDGFTRLMLVDTIAHDFNRPEQFPEITERYSPQMQYRGFRRCVLDTMRGGSLDNYRETYRRIGASGRPVLLVWGTGDTTVPYEVSQTARELMPEAKFVAIEDARHFALYERPEAVNPALVDFLFGR